MKNGVKKEMKTISKTIFITVYHKELVLNNFLVIDTPPLLICVKDEKVIFCMFKSDKKKLTKLQKDIVKKFTDYEADVVKTGFEFKVIEFQSRLEKNEPISWVERTPIATVYD
jgi:hypothetical protein